MPPTCTLARVDEPAVNAVVRIVRRRRRGHLPPMHLDLVDHLRCPNAHPGLASPVALVCVPLRVDGRTLQEAMLGCPTCRASYAVVQGAGWFGVGDAPAPRPLPAPTARAARGADDDPALRLAAFLGLDTPGGTVLVEGTWATSARALAAMAECSVVVLADAPDPGALAPLSVLVGVGDALPLAAGTLRGAAFASVPHPALLADAARCLMPNGRLVAPVEAAPPPVLSVLARDDRWWVAEARPAPVAIRRAPPPPRTPGQ